MMVLPATMTYSFLMRRSWWRKTEATTGKFNRINKVPAIEYTVYLIYSICLSLSLKVILKVILSEDRFREQVIILNEWLTLEIQLKWQGVLFSVPVQVPPVPCTIIMRTHISARRNLTDTSSNLSASASPHRVPIQSYVFSLMRKKNKHFVNPGNLSKAGVEDAGVVISAIYMTS